MKLISQALSTTGSKIRLGIVAGTILIGGAATAASMGVITNPIAPASQTQPQAIVQSTAPTATSEPINSPETNPEAVTASQGSSNAAASGSELAAPKPTPAQTMGKCRQTNGDGSIKYDANDQPVMADCVITAAPTPAATPTPDPTPAPVDNSGTTVSNPNHQ